MSSKRKRTKKTLFIKVSLIIAGFLFFIPAFVQAQTAAELEAILETSAVTCAQAAWFVSSAAGDGTSPGAGSSNAASSNVASSNITSAEASFQQALAKGWLKKGTTPGESITLGKLSFLVMKAFGMRGGLMYTIFPGTRYAFRTMVNRSYIQGAADPAMTVSGERFLHILGKALNAGGEEI